LYLPNIAQKNNIEKKSVVIAAVGWKDIDRVSKESPYTLKRTGLCKAAHFLNFEGCRQVGGTENAIDLNFAAWWQCGELIQGLDDWSETQDMKENTIMREERQLRDAARRKTLTTQSLDVTLSRIFVLLFLAMSGRYKQTFARGVYSFLCKSL
jgi:hypothetical protein